MDKLFQRLRGLSLVRFLVGGIVVALTSFGVQLLLYGLGGLFGIQHEPAWKVFAYMASVPTVLAGYVGYVRWFEQRAVDELAFLGGRQVLAGTVAGVALFAGVLGTAAAFGVVSITAGAGMLAIVSLAISATSAVTEELLFRGLLFRLAERSLGTWPAIGISAVLFGCFHLVNPGAGVVSTVAIALESGLLLAAAFVLTRNLWLAIGLHFGWGVTESAVFGATMSGHPDPGLLLTRLHGQEILSGGAFGIEASVVAMGWVLVATIILLILAHRRGQIQPIRFGAAA